MDKHDRSKFITHNLQDLVDSTFPGSEMANSLLTRGLITNKEHRAMVNTATDEYDKATQLYTSLASKWNDDQFKLFIQVLEETKNTRAFEIFTADGAEVFLTRNQVEFLKIQMTKLTISENTVYEGICMEDEIVAETVQGYLRDGKMFVEDKFQLHESLQERRRDVVPVIKRFIKIIKEKKVWINSSKPRLPNHYIDRKVYGIGQFKTSLLETVLTQQDKLILLADAPGMGKSSLLTKLEQDLRRDSRIASSRIIIRKNLNQCSKFLKQIVNQAQITLSTFIQQFADFIPTNELRKDLCIPAYLLLDGLDEVLPLYKDAMMKLLEVLLFTSVYAKCCCVYVEKVVLTTRPHLREMIEKAFKVKAYSLVPLSTEQQVQYLLNAGELYTKKEAETKLNQFPRFFRDLMSNPLMLYLYSQVCADTSGVSDLYSLYTLFMEKKHELFVCDKEGGDPDCQASIRRKKQLLNENLSFYYFLSVKELLGTNDMRRVLLLDKQCPGEDILKEPSAEKVEELLSYGLINQIDKFISSTSYDYKLTFNAGPTSMIRFKHKSFAEYFYAKTMTDFQNTSRELRNILFSFGYNFENNLARFVSCVCLKDPEAVQFVSTGWINFALQKTLFSRLEFNISRYIQGTERKLIDHILANTIVYDKECEQRNQLLVRDTYHEKVFVKWLSDTHENNRAWVRDTLLQETMSKVLAAIVLSTDEKMISFVKEFLLENGQAERRIKQVLKLCPKIIQIAVKWEFVRESKQMCTEMLFERLKKWFSLEDLKTIALVCLSTNDNSFMGVIIEDIQMSSFFASILPPDEIFNVVWSDGVEIIVKDFWRCWGKEFCPKYLLKFRFNCGYHKGKSLFNLKYFPDYLIERAWGEVEKNFQDAVEVIHVDGDTSLIEKLEESLSRLEGSHDLKEKRRELIIKILDKINWSRLSVFQHVDQVRLIAYGKMTTRDWEVLLTENNMFDLILTKHLNCMVRCILMSAVNGIRTNSDVGPSPFELVQKWASKSKSQLLDFMGTLLALITRMSREELSVLAKLKRKDPTLLSDLPCWWEIFFTPKHGIAYTKQKETMVMMKKTDGMQEIVKAIFHLNERSIRFSSSTTKAFELLAQFYRLREMNLVTNVLQRENVLREFTDGVTNTWLKDVDIAKKYVKKVVRIYMEFFESDWDSWIDIIANKIPVQLLVIGDEQRKKSNHTWMIVLIRVLVRVRDHFVGGIEFSLKDIPFKYNRECDWYRLFLEIPEFRKRVPSDFNKKTQVYLTWPCSLLRVWIRMQLVDNDAKLTSFWEMAAKEMNDGELIHIAVELESLVGVKSTAWPGFLNWTHKDKTALEFSNEIWGKDHEITEYLQTVTDNLVTSGFLPNTKNHVTMSQSQGVVKPATSSSSRLFLKRKREPSPVCSQSYDTKTKVT